MSMHSVIVHQHLYQPPREDPWLEVIETERSAAPDHDWNTRITRECYARQSAAEAYLLEGARAAPKAGDPNARVGLARLINLYAWCSFDVGATLCEWLDSEAPHVLESMRAGDAASIARWGHGNAMAAPYHHVILPLASRRDRITEIRWGIRDFTRRFGRAPEGFWFPECAVDQDSLDAVAAEGIRFTILAAYQVKGHSGTGMPVRWRGTSGHELIVVPYEAVLSSDVAFGGLLNDARNLAHRLTPYRDIELESPRCTTLASDGETFGHHYHGGESTLAEAMSLMARRTDSRLTNAATLVATHGGEVDIALVSPSSWSCAHGVERWRSNCGCRIDGSRPPAQQWRGPLRHAMEQLAERCAAVFSEEGSSLFVMDPWHVRDMYGDVVAAGGDAITSYLDSVIRHDASAAEKLRARELLELARASLRTFTSCAWFFDDVDRLEVRQVLRYAARSIELTGLAARLTPEFVHWLTGATSGSANAVSAADVFVRDALPHREPALCVAAGFMALATAGIDLKRFGAFEGTVERTGLSDVRVRIIHSRTGRTGKYVGSVTGTGPATVVTIGADHAAESMRIPVRLHEFPDRLAYLLLQHGATTDSALLAEP